MMQPRLCIYYVRVLCTHRGSIQLVWNGDIKDRSIQLSVSVYAVWNGHQR